MAIFLDDSSRVVVQGMTGSQGLKHTARMLASGTQIVGGVTPGKGGQQVDIDGLQAFEEDPDTDAIVMIGEIGGDAEERAGEYISEHITKPVVGYIAGFTAPEGKTMGHAGAIVSGSSGTAQAKQDALEKAGVRVGKTPSEAARIMTALLTS